MRLSELIRRGLPGTEQAHGVYFQGTNRACAIGAAMRAEGMGSPAYINDFRDRWHRVLDQPARCPRWLECGISADVEAVLIHMNDDHRVSREDIAAWLEAQDL